MKIFNRVQTLARIIVCLMLIYPMPIAVGVEQTVNEDFSDSKPYRSFMRVNLFSKIYNEWLITKAFK